MTGKEYIEIFKENNLVRSELVRFIEGHIKTFETLGMKDEAEESKWIAIALAEEEKAYGPYFYEGELLQNKGTLVEV